MKLVTSVELTGDEMVSNYIQSGGSYEGLIKFILDADLEIADYNFTTMLIAKLVESLSKDSDDIEPDQLNDFLESLKC